MTSCGAFWWDESCTECAPVSHRCVVEWVGPIIDSILLANTAISESSSAAITSLALWINLMGLLASAALSLLPQHATA